MKNYATNSLANKMLNKLQQMQDDAAMLDAPKVETIDGDEVYRFELTDIVGEIVIHVHNENAIEAHHMHNEEVLEWLDYLLENVGK